MPHALTSLIVTVVVVGTLVTSASSVGPSTPRGSFASLRAGVAGAAFQGTGTVYVSATDKKGSVVADLPASEFEVKVGGKTQEVISVEPAAARFRIALLVADAGTGTFQLGLARFIQKLLKHAEFKLISVMVQPETVVDYSTDAGALIAGVRRLGPRGRESSAQLMEAIQEATKDVPHEGTRPIIVVMRVGGEATTPISGNDARAQLRKSGAILYVISTVGAQRPAPPQARGTDAVSVQQGQLRDDELKDGAFNLAQVLGDGSKESGGRHAEIVSTTLVPALEQVADELLHQLEITYVLPERVKPGDKLSVSSKRKGVKVHAPTRLRY